MRTEGLTLYWLALACLLLQLLPAEARLWLELHPATWWQGEYWRLLTGHLVHAGWWHWLLNALGIAVLQQLLGPYLAVRHWMACCLFSAVFVSVGLGLISSLSYYLGFSGLLHALFIFAALQALAREKVVALAVLAIVLGKVVLEQIAGPAESSARLIGIAVATDAHWLGAVAGLCFYLARALWSGPLKLQFR
ncbi:rhombosortase [Exilibacterium tricleocarpae]|uniref:rhombosortase n=1 Tax=Exilibacterium tricleocarpae TaxID=2591008 RepID=UPI0015D392EF|nr:rhombosortase [Exilibacterium tricleocarpae]